MMSEGLCREGAVGAERKFLLAAVVKRRGGLRDELCSCGLPGGDKAPLVQGAGLGLRLYGELGLVYHGGTAERASIL
jgi:hypothetical protein